MRRRESPLFIGHAEPPPITLNAAMATASDAANARMWKAGRKQWDAEDYALAERTLCAVLRKMPAPYPALAAAIACEPKKEGVP